MRNELGWGGSGLSNSFAKAKQPRTLWRGGRRVGLERLGQRLRRLGVIFILEDNLQRVAQFRAAAELVAPGVPLRVWGSAHAMIRDLVDCLEHATVISLDHDLKRVDGEYDPGTGYDVAALLGELIPWCPVTIHTSNGEGGRWMGGALALRGWQFERVYPDEKDWVFTRWACVLRRMLKS